MFNTYESTAMSARVTRWVNGTTPLPERYMFGTLCTKPEHTFKGKTVRYICDGQCVLCTKKRNQVYRNNKSDHRDMDALNIAEEKMYQEEVDPLFDNTGEEDE